MSNRHDIERSLVRRIKREDNHDDLDLESAIGGKLDGLTKRDQALVRLRLESLIVRQRTEATPSTKILSQ